MMHRSWSCLTILCMIVVTVAADEISPLILERRPVLQANLRSVCFNPDNHMCYIAYNNSLICDGQLLLPDIQWSMIACDSYSSLCGISTHGTVRCLPSRYDFTYSTDAIPLGTSFASISNAARMSCALSWDGLPSCWGQLELLGEAMLSSLTSHRWRSLVVTSPPFDTVPFRICGITLLDASLICYENKPSGWQQYANHSSPWYSLDCRNEWCCGLLFNGTVRCWGETSSHSHWRHIPDERFQSLWIGREAICGLLMNNSESLFCWGCLRVPPEIAHCYAPDPPVSFGINAQHVVDMSCNDGDCWLLYHNDDDDGDDDVDDSEDTSRRHHALFTWTPRASEAAIVPSQHYTTIYSRAATMYRVCARLQPSKRTTGGRLSWHCTHTPIWQQYLNEPRPPSTTMNDIMVLSWSPNQQYGFYILTNGSLIEYTIASYSPPFINLPVPNPNHTWIDVCSASDTACGIIIRDGDGEEAGGGKIVCWRQSNVRSVNASRPWTGGAIHDDYIAIECTRFSFCAMRQSREVNCWGVIESFMMENDVAVQQPPRVPLLKLLPYSSPITSDKSKAGYYGILAENLTLWQWFGVHSPPEPVTNLTTEPVVDFITSYPSNGCQCIILASSSSSANHDQQLVCNTSGSLPSLSRVGVLDTRVTGPLNLSNHLTSYGDGGICVIVRGQVICSGPGLTRLRWGGHAMLPRTSLKRIVYISVNGSDTPFCGLHYFKACASLKYAMSPLESSGVWIEYRFGSGTHSIDEAITVDWSGVSLVGSNVTTASGSPSTILMMNQPLIVKAPSFSLRHIAMVTPSTYTSALAPMIPIVARTFLLFGSGAFDCVIHRSLFNTPDIIEVVGGASLTIRHSLLFGTSVSVVTANLTMVESSVAPLGGKPKPIGVFGIAINSHLRFYHCSFENLYNFFDMSLAGLSITGGTFTMVSCTWSHCNQLMLVDVSPVVIHTSTFKSSPTVALVDVGGGIMINGKCTVIITSCVFTQLSSVVYGHALAMTGTNHVTISQSQWISNGGSEQGRGMIYCRGASSTDPPLLPLRPSSTLILDSITSQGNYAEMAAGGVYASFCRVSVYNMTARHNWAWLFGGVFYLANCITVIRDGLYEGNKAYYGGVATQVQSTLLYVNGTTRFEYNVAFTAGSVWFTRQPVRDDTLIDVQFPIFTQGSLQLYMNNTATALGNDAARVSDVQYIRALHPAIVNHTSGATIAPGVLVFELLDLTRQRFAAPWSYPSLTLTVSPADDDPYSLWSSLEGTLVMSYDRLSGLVPFDYVMATSHPGTNRTYQVTLSSDDATHQLITSLFYIHYRNCTPGEYTFNEWLCVDCVAGSYSMNTTATACDRCAAGSFAANEKASSCEACARGSYQATPGGVECFKCGLGSYSITEGSTQCVLCDDTPGLTCEMGGLVHVEIDYWAWIVTPTQPGGVTRLATRPCVKGRCTGGEFGSSRFEPCGEHRVQNDSNSMCGHCEPGYTEIGTACHECDSPSGGMIVLVIVIVLTLVTTLHVFAQTKSSGLPPIFLYFVQIAMLMLPSSSSWLAWIGIFSGAVTNAAFGICIAPMTATEQMILSISSILIFWCALAVLMCIQCVCSRLCVASVTCQRGFTSVCTGYDHGASMARIWRSVIGIYLFSYSIMAKTLVGYLSCVDVGDGQSVIFMEPTISCTTDSYRAWLAVIIILLIVLIIVPPVGFIVYLTRNRHRFNDVRFIGRWGNLYEHYQPVSYWYQSFVLLRRVLFTMVDITLVILPSFKYMIFTIMHLLSLIIHQLLQPYTTPLFNRMELLTLSSLTIIAVILATFPDTKDITRYNSVQILLTLTVMIPLVVFGGYALVRLYRTIVMKTAAARPRHHYDAPAAAMNADMDQEHVHGHGHDGVPHDDGDEHHHMHHANDYRTLSASINE